MIELVRSSSYHPDFVALVGLLDAELAIRDGDDHAFYSQFNKIDKIKYCVIIYLDGTPCACGAIRALDGTDIEVKRMFVHPAYRNKGLATKVLKELEIWAAELGYQQCILETGINQPEAIALYEKCGYHRIPNYGQYVGVDNSNCFAKMIKL